MIDTETKTNQHAGTRIVRLQAENVKRLRAVSVTPEGNLVVIGGRNAQGKSSLLDSIMYALAGGRALCGQPLRRGASKGLAELTLSNGMTVRRTFTPKGGQLAVTKPDGSDFAGPQAMLDAMAGDLTFDPLAFLRMDGRKQLEALRRIVGLDFSELNARRADLEATRAAAGRDIKGFKSELARLPFQEGAPGQEVSVGELVDELHAAERANSVNDAKRQARQDMMRRTEKLADEERHAEEQIAQWQGILKKKRAETAEAIRELKALGGEVAALKDLDIAPIRHAIGNAETTNARVRGNAARANVEARLTAASAEWNDADAGIKAVDAAKAKAVSEADMPVAGMAFDEQCVSYNGVPFDQASSAEQLRISCGMAAAAAPELRIMLIRDGSLLDADSRRLLAEFADERDYQLWIEVVDGDCQVVIEDGCVVGQFEAATAVEGPGSKLEGETAEDTEAVML